MGFRCQTPLIHFFRLGGLMKRSFLYLLAILVFALVSASPVMAQATRTWVSGVGDDANPCSRTAPCKTFAGAISKTAPGGEIDALDPGGFGALTITKSITIDGGGGQVASVLVAGTNGIVVAAGATDIVILRNLRFDGLLGGGNANAGLSAISFTSGGTLIVDKCEIFGFATNGIRGAPTSPSTAQLIVTGTSISNIQTAAVTIAPGAGVTLFASLSKVNISTSANGIVTKAGGVANLNDSLISQFSGTALWPQAGTLTAAHNVISNGGTAVLGQGGVVRLDGNNIYNNNIAVQTGAGTISTMGNNVLAGNNGNLNSGFTTY